jgi:hypothetical protein
LLHKLREAMAEEMKDRVVSGEGKEAEVDGWYFGGYIRPANFKADRKDHRFCAEPKWQEQGCGRDPGNGGNSVPAVFHSGSQAFSFIRARIA